MAVFLIRTFGDPVLRQPAREVAVVDDDIRKLISNMIVTMRQAPGIGLAAPQVGVSKRIIVWEHEEEVGSLINPRITDGEGAEVADEGCLSLPGLSYPVERHSRVRAFGLDGSGKEVFLEAEGLKARILQHEVDHLDGVLFIDRIDPDLQKDARRRLREMAMGVTSSTDAPAI